MNYSNEQNDFLKSLYPDKQTNLNSASPEIYLELLRAKLLTYTGSNFHDKSVALSEKGKAYVEKLNTDKAEHDFQRFHIWANTIIAVIALLIALFK